jgi:LacI family transcriptional regulator
VYDVAALAGVGVKTVSRVINGEHVRPASQLAVTTAIAELGFRRNRSAATLRTNQSDCIGFVVRDVSDPFNGVLMEAVERIIREFGFVLLAASCNDDPALQEEVIHACLTHDVAGLIVAPTQSSQAYLVPEVESGTAVVFIDRHPRDINGDTVLADNMIGAREAVRHLISLGHRKIAYVGDSGALATSTERREGYTQALLEGGLIADPTLIDMATPDEARTAMVVRDLLELPDPPTALFTGNARLTRAVLRALSDLPARPALVGFDDFDLADLIGVTVVAQDPEVIGETAANLLLGRIKGRTGRSRHVRVPTRLIVRQSGSGLQFPPLRTTRAATHEVT